MSNAEAVYRIVRHIFTNGDGVQAERLALEFHGEPDGSGWSVSAMANSILFFLDEQGYEIVSKPQQHHAPEGGE